jgi:DNA-directed RNA polymerase specialized sigma24 family protein
MAMEFRNQLESDLGVKLSSTLIWEYPTIDRLTSHLADKLNALSESERAELLLSTLDQLSDEDVNALLEAMLLEEEEDL